jgi:hypothetical protein
VRQILSDDGEQSVDWDAGSSGELLHLLVAEGGLQLVASQGNILAVLIQPGPHMLTHALLLQLGEHALEPFSAQHLVHDAGQGGGLRLPQDVAKRSLQRIGPTHR